MMRTRNFVIAVFSSVMGLFLIVLLVMSGDTPRQIGVQSNPAIFLIPHETYNVAPFTEESIRDTREAFIEKVRKTYVPQEKQVAPVEEKEVQPEVVPESLPVMNVSGTTTATTTLDIL